MNHRGYQPHRPPPQQGHLPNIHLAPQNLSHNPFYHRLVHPPYTQHRYPQPLSIQDPYSQPPIQNPCSQPPPEMIEPPSMQDAYSQSPETIKPLSVQDPYSQPPIHDTYSQPPMQNPFSQPPPEMIEPPSMQDAYSQSPETIKPLSVQDPYSQPPIHDTYSQPPMQDQSSQRPTETIKPLSIQKLYPQLPIQDSDPQPSPETIKPLSMQDPYSQPSQDTFKPLSMQEPYSQPLSIQDPYPQPSPETIKPLSMQDPYSQPSQDTFKPLSMQDPYSQPLSIQDPYPQPSPETIKPLSMQDPYSQPQPEIIKPSSMEDIYSQRPLETMSHQDCYTTERNYRTYTLDNHPQNDTPDTQSLVTPSHISTDVISMQEVPTVQSKENTHEFCNLKIEESLTGKKIDTNYEERENSIEQDQKFDITKEKNFTEQNQKTDVMLSYQWEDQNTVLKIKEFLEKRNLKVWVDIERMDSNINKSMADAVKNTSVVIMCLSKKYQSSYNCQKEYNFIDKKQKSFIPVFMEEFEIEAADLDIILGQQLYFDLHSNEFDEEMTKICKAVENRLSNQ